MIDSNSTVRSKTILTECREALPHHEEVLTALHSQSTPPPPADAPPLPSDLRDALRGRFGSQQRREMVPVRASLWQRLQDWMSEPTGRWALTGAMACAVAVLAFRPWDGGGGPGAMDSSGGGAGVVLRGGAAEAPVRPESSGGLAVYWVESAAHASWIPAFQKAFPTLQVVPAITEVPTDSAAIFIDPNEGVYTAQKGQLGELQAPVGSPSDAAWQQLLMEKASQLSTSLAAGQ